MLRKTVVVALIIGDKAKDATVYSAVAGVTRPRAFVVLDRQLAGIHEFGSLPALKRLVADTEAGKVKLCA